MKIANYYYAIIKRFNGGDLTAGDIVSGLPVVVVYKLASDTWYMVSAAAALFANMHADFNENASPGNPAVNTVRLYASDESGVTHLHYRRDSGSVVRLRTATQAEMEAASTQETFSTPGRQHFHPGHPKAHGRVNSDGTLQTGSYGIASAAKTGTGEYTVTLSTAINDPTVKAGPREGQRVVFGSPSSSTVMAVSSRNSNNATAQDSSFWIEVAGDH